MTPRWPRLLLAAVLIVVPLWAFFSRLDALWHGHPLYPALVFLLLGIGLVLLFTAFRPWRHAVDPLAPDDVDPAASAHTQPAPAGPVPRADNAQPVRPPRTTSGRWLLAARIAGAALALVVVGALVWLRPFPAEPAALAATQSDDLVTVTDFPTRLELRPAAQAPTTGLVFTPGARVDARAYAAILRPHAEVGVLVVILKAPLGIPLVQPGQSGGPIDEHPEIRRWVVGGHSLGGVTAAGFAGDGGVGGLLLYASYPLGDLAGVSGLDVLSVSGTNDGLTTPADIDDSRAKLPPDTAFVAIEGAVHAFFGDYGEQPGDGVPRIARADATDQIVAVTGSFLREVAAGG